MTSSDPEASTEDVAFVTQRDLPAPRAAVYAAHVEPDRLVRWWGPQGVTLRVCRLDLRPGGQFLYGMRGPVGPELYGRFVYREVVPLERLVFTVAFADAEGGVQRNPMNPLWPLETLSTLTFADADGGTRLSMRWEPVDATPVERATFGVGRTLVAQGCAATLDRLAAHLARG